jgi:lipopolysaccharide/colanic/teichoic acid biosynthesis glycosyltransferase
MKRIFDIVVASLGVLVVLPVLIAIAVAIKLTSAGPVFFRQERIGRRFRPFFIYKFRTMVQDAPKRGGPITFGDDPRITPIGKILRKSKFDEIPQLFNILKGEMSCVGPRPEVPRYVNMFRADYEDILQVRPGLTDLASLKYCDEAALLGQAVDPEREYIDHVLPEKIRLAKEYVRRRSLWLDMTLLARTVLRVCHLSEMG